MNWEEFSWMEHFQNDINDLPRPFVGHDGDASTKRFINPIESNGTTSMRFIPYSKFPPSKTVTKGVAWRARSKRRTEGCQYWHVYFILWEVGWFWKFDNAEYHGHPMLIVFEWKRGYQLGNMVSFNWVIVVVRAFVIRCKYPGYLLWEKMWSCYEIFDDRLLMSDSLHYERGDTYTGYGLWKEHPNRNPAIVGSTEINHKATCEVDFVMTIPVHGT